MIRQMLMPQARNTPVAGTLAQDRLQNPGPPGANVRFMTLFKHVVSGPSTAPGSWCSSQEDLFFEAPWTFSTFLRLRGAGKFW